MPAQNCLTTKEVARLCRVSDATVKRWQEAGLLHSERTNGGHRRFRAEEVARFQREQGLGLKERPGDESVNTALTRRRENKEHSSCPLFQALMAGREEEAFAMLLRQQLNGKDLAGLFDQVLAPALCRVGELWYAGEVTVAQEHLASRTALNAVHRLRNVVPIPQASGNLAMCCGIEGDYHELSIHMAQMTFEHSGWEVVNFGANTPLYSLADEALHHAPNLICISAAVLSDVERLARDFREFRLKIERLGIPVVLGGRPFADETIKRRFPAEFYPSDFSSLSRFANGALGKN